MLIIWTKHDGNRVLFIGTGEFIVSVYLSPFIDIPPVVVETKFWVTPRSVPHNVTLNVCGAAIPVML